MIRGNSEIDNDHRIAVDGDYLDSEMGAYMGYQSTGFADDDAALSPGANMLAGDDLMSDHAEMCKRVADADLTIAEAKIILEESAPHHAFGLDDNHKAYAGLPFDHFAEITGSCEIRVIPLDEHRNLIKGAEWRKFEAGNWRDAINVCLSTLFPNPCAA